MALQKPLLFRLLFLLFFNQQLLLFEETLNFCFQFGVFYGDCAFAVFAAYSEIFALRFAFSQILLACGEFARQCLAVFGDVRSLSI